MNSSCQVSAGLRVNAGLIMHQWYKFKQSRAEAKVSLFPAAFQPPEILVYSTKISSVKY
jgi:hypothetical protein